MVATTPTASHGFGWWKLGVAFLAGGLVGAISVVQVVPPQALRTQDPRGPEEGFAPEEAGPGLEGENPSGEGAGAESGPGQRRITSRGPGGSSTAESKNPKGLECRAGKNGGATDTGVSGDKILFAANTVTDGVGKDFLGQVEYGMEAVVLQINAKGVCGRKVEVRYNNDGWSASDGRRAINNYINNDPPVFALAVWPSSEGLRVAIANKEIRNAGMPVVGVGGMLIDEYLDPWVWPVAVSSASSARIMVREAYNRLSASDKTNPASYSIVFDNNYRFGVEAAEAFNNEVRRITGSDVPGYTPEHVCSTNTKFCGVQAGKLEYGPEVQAFRPGKFVAMFLEPVTGLAWMKSGGPQSIQGYMVDGAQPLFTEGFASNCQEKCDGMRVWTGYKPYIETYTNDPAVQTYVNALRTLKSDADKFNQFTEGGYLGMLLVWRALEKVGPNLTRRGFKTALDSLDMTASVSLEPKLSWRSGNHFSAATMRTYVMKTKQSIGWEEGPIVSDPSPQETAAGIQR